MKKRGFLFSLLVCVAISLSLAVSLPAQQRQLKKLRIGTDGDPDVVKLPFLIACEEARNVGIDITPVYFPTPDVVLKALILGDIDLATAGGIVLMNAVSAGQSLVAVTELWKNEFSLLAPRTIKNIQELDGKRIAYHAPLSQTEAFVKWMAKKYNLTPKWVVIPGSDVRTEALRKGMIDATPANILDFINLDAQEPGKYQILLSFAEVASLLINHCLVAKPDWTGQNRDTLEAIIKMVVLQNRATNASPGVVMEKGSKFLPGQNQNFIKRGVEEYVRRGIWNVNGGLTEKGAYDTMKFFLEAGILKQEVPTEKWVDTRLLENVLNQIGRK